MFGTTEILLTAAAASIVTTFLIVFIWKKCRIKNNNSPVSITTHIDQTLQNGIAKLHEEQSPQFRIDFDMKSIREKKTKKNFNLLRSQKPVFNWVDHPLLIIDAVENGWSRFGFVLSSSSTKSPSLLGFCAAGDSQRQKESEEAQIYWEVLQGSSDFMQKVRLNKGLLFMRKSKFSVIRTALPLPGPQLGNCCFPQESYFEITILSTQCENDELANREGDRIKLIQTNSNSKSNSNSNSVHHVNSSHRTKSIEEMRLAVEDNYVKDDDVEDDDANMVFSVGLTSAGFLPMKPPGSYHGSIGFNSNASVFVDGIKIVVESEKVEWGKTDKTIGCGFDPRQKKVIFTIDSELVHEIHCKSEEFGSPLYPTLASNSDMMVLVNFGQSSFAYAPANAQRIPNPCFVGSVVRSPALGYEDSKELFSMGRIDSQWHNQSTSRGNNVVNRGADDFDEESEADLFEIILGSSGTSPISHLQQH